MVVADVMNSHKEVIRMGSNPMTGVLIKREFGHRYAHRENAM